MRIYMAVEVSRKEGPNLSSDLVREALEAEMEEHLEVDTSYYSVEVVGSGDTMTALRESLRLRKVR